MVNTEYKIKNKGFTIVETLVAITILMIAIAGPLVAASRSLNAALYSRDQMIASFLAQESMEMMKSLRSKHVALNGSGSGWFIPYSSCNVDNVCDASVLGTIGVPEVKSCPDGGCLLTFDPNPNRGYVTDGPGDGLKFYRYFYLEDTTNPLEIRLHVVVTWNQGKIPYELELVSQMFDSII